MVTLQAPPFTSTLYMSAPIWVASLTVPMPRVCLLSKSRLTAPPDTGTEAPVPGRRGGGTVKDPPLRLSGTAPAGLPSVMSTRAAPVLISIDPTCAVATLYVSVDAPELVWLVHGRIALV